MPLYDNKPKTTTTTKTTLGYQLNMCIYRLWESLFLDFYKLCCCGSASISPPALS
jgi:hypothetical protein